MPTAPRWVEKLGHRCRRAGGACRLARCPRTPVATRTSRARPGRWPHGADAGPTSLCCTARDRCREGRQSFLSFSRKSWEAANLWRGISCILTNGRVAPFTFRLAITHRPRQNKGATPAAASSTPNAGGWFVPGRPVSFHLSVHRLSCPPVCPSTYPTPRLVHSPQPPFLGGPSSQNSPTAIRGS